MTEEWTTEVFGLLSRPTACRVLMVAGERGWSLPGTRIQGRPHLEPSLATKKMRQLLESPVVATRYIAITSDEGDKRQQGMFVLDAVDEVPEQSDSKAWVGRENLSSLHRERPDHHGVVDGFLREVERGTVPKFRQPWEQPGWFAAASGWITETLSGAGREVAASMEQVRWWSLSSVLRVPTTNGDVYFKASTPVRQ